MASRAGLGEGSSGYFMMPLEANDQSHFLEMGVPPHCRFCMPASPDAIVEVRAKWPVTWAMEPGDLCRGLGAPSLVSYRS